MAKKKSNVFAMTKNKTKAISVIKNDLGNLLSFFQGVLIDK